MTITPMSILSPKVSRATRLTRPERKPEVEARNSQFLNSLRGIPIAESLPVPRDCGSCSPLASRKPRDCVPNCMVKSPVGAAYDCWRTTLLQTRSTITSCGIGVLSLVVTRPWRNITRSVDGWPGVELGKGEFEGRPGFEDGGE